MPFHIVVKLGLDAATAAPSAWNISAEQDITATVRANATLPVQDVRGKTTQHFSAELFLEMPPCQPLASWGSAEAVVLQQFRSPMGLPNLIGQHLCAITHCLTTWRLSHDRFRDHGDSWVALPDQAAVVYPIRPMGGCTALVSPNPPSERRRCAMILAVTSTAGGLQNARKHSQTGAPCLSAKACGVLWPDHAQASIGPCRYAHQQQEPTRMGFGTTQRALNSVGCAHFGNVVQESEHLLGVTQHALHRFGICVVPKRTSLVRRSPCSRAFPCKIL